MSEVLNVEEIFGEQVFTLGKMKERLPKKVFQEVKQIMDCGGEMSLATADVVAKAMKDWAVENGATHYTHWFQPLTGITAEKHDAIYHKPGCHGQGAHGVLRQRADQRASRMLPPSPPAVYVPPSRQEAIQPGTALPRHS